MLLRRRTPRISTRHIDPVKGFEHLDQTALALLGWLKDNRIEFVLVGPMAEALRGRVGAVGPVGIVPAPYRRNYARLAAALADAGACMRADGVGPGGGSDRTPLRVTADKLARSQRWTLSCGPHDIDIESSGARAPSYQELLYEAGRFEPIVGIGVEVASPEDIEHYAHLRRTGRAPEMRISRRAPADTDPAPTEAPPQHSPPEQG